MQLVLSPRIMNIYYSDMFIINGRGCLIMGHGKSHCARIASGDSRSNEVGQDLICLSRTGDELFGHYEMSHVPNVFKPEPSKIEVFVRCLSEEETNKTFNGNKLDILFAEHDSFFQACRFNITFTVDPMGTLRQSLGNRYPEYVDHDQRGIRFHKLTSGLPGAKYLVLPWMPSVEEKATLLKSNV